MTFPAGGRGLDLDGNGSIDVGEGAQQGPPIGILLASNSIKQSIIDTLQLVQVIKAGVDIDGDGQNDLNAGRQYFSGFSLGSFVGVPAFTLEPALRAATFTGVGGWPVLWFIPSSRGAFGAYLQNHLPSLMNPGGTPGITSIGGLPVGAPILRRESARLWPSAHRQQRTWCDCHPGRLGEIRVAVEPVDAGRLCDTPADEPARRFVGASVPDPHRPRRAVGSQPADSGPHRRRLACGSRRRTLAWGAVRGGASLRARAKPGGSLATLRRLWGGRHSGDSSEATIAIEREGQCVLEFTLRRHRSSLQVVGRLQPLRARYG